MSAEAEPFTVGEAPALAGETDGEGAPVVLVHGLTATRRYVVHGSRVLRRRGLRAVSYDARGHGESDPAPAGQGYSYDELATDLAAVIEAQGAGRRCVLAGHSMGAHTIANLALGQPDLVAGMVLVGPVALGAQASPESLEYWDALADGLAGGGVEGFIEAYDTDLDPAWRDTLLRITRDRLGRHRHPQAVAEALRQVPRSTPFADVAELELLDVPSLVVASHDEADPGHPYAVAEEWAARLPRATLVSEKRGESPLAWQGGRLSRAIADFCERPGVARELSA